MLQQGSRKLTAFFSSIAVYLILMMAVIIFLKPEHFSLESFSISLATGIMVISYGFYASNAYVHAKGESRGNGAKPAATLSENQNKEARNDPENS